MCPHIQQYVHPVIIKFSVEVRQILDNDGFQLPFRGGSEVFCHALKAAVWSHCRLTGTLKSGSENELANPFCE